MTARLCRRKDSNNAIDTMGIAASSVCMVHCALMPVVISLLPMVGAGWLEHDWTHKILAFLVLSLALSSVVPAYLRHRTNSVLFAMAAGLSLVLFATFACGHIIHECYEVPLISIGNILVVAAHLRNRAVLRTCC